MPLHRPHGCNRQSEFILYRKPHGKRNADRQRQDNNNRPKRQAACSVLVCSIGETNNHPKEKRPNNRPFLFSYMETGTGPQIARNGDRDGPQPLAGGHGTQAKRITTQKSPTEPQTQTNRYKPTPETRKGRTGQNRAQERPKIAPV